MYIYIYIYIDTYTHRMAAACKNEGARADPAPERNLAIRNLAIRTGACLYNIYILYFIIVTIVCYI